MTQNDRFKELKVLVVDDDRFMLTLIREILISLGIHGAHDVSDPLQALDEVKRLSPDLIITDWQMEPMDGLEFVRTVRRREDIPNPFVPIIMVSGRMDREIVQKARDSGANEVVAKPVSIGAIEKRIIAVIDHPRPFIVSKTYFGPDRRRQDLGPPPGVPERRTATAKKIESQNVKQLGDMLRR